MKTTAQVRAESVAQRHLAREYRSTGRQPNRLDQFWRVRHFQTHHITGRERAGFQLSHPLLRVHAQNIFVAGRLGPQNILFLCQTLT